MNVLLVDGSDNPEAYDLALNSFKEKKGDNIGFFEF